MLGRLWRFAMTGTVSYGFDRSASGGCFAQHEQERLRWRRVTPADGERERND
jgi:hypothetical protein